MRGNAVRSEYRDVFRVGTKIVNRRGTTGGGWDVVAASADGERVLYSGHARTLAGAFLIAWRKRKTVDPLPMSELADTIVELYFRPPWPTLNPESGLFADRQEDTGLPRG